MHNAFIEYGALAVAAQRGRRSLDDLIARTPTDGLIAGIGSVNGSLFGDDNARCIVVACVYTAGKPQAAHRPTAPSGG